MFAKSDLRPNSEQPNMKHFDWLKITKSLYVAIQNALPKYKRKPNVRGAAVAQWIRLRFPSYCPGFEFQANHLRFYQFKFEFKL